MTGLPPVYASPDYLRAVAGRDVSQRIRARVHDLLGLELGMQVLDVGCGPGTGTIALAEHLGPAGRVVGVDRDPVMVSEAAAAAVNAGVADRVRHRVADATALPFANGEFDACTSERLLQHLPPPAAAQAFAEMARVVRPEGRLVIVDTDWASLTVDAPEPAVEREIVFSHTLRFANPYSGRQLRRLAVANGLEDVTCETFPGELAYDDVRLLLAGAEQLSLACGRLRPDSWHRWHAALFEANAAGALFAQVSRVVVAGRRRTDGGTRV